MPSIYSHTSKELDYIEVYALDNWGRGRVEVAVGGYQTERVELDAAEVTALRDALTKYLEGVE